MSTGLPKGRRLDPIEAFEVTPWRALALFRVTSLVYAIALTAHNSDTHAWPPLSWAVTALMLVWTGLSIAGYEQARLRAWPLLLADLVVTAVCVLVGRVSVGADALAQGVPTLTITWMACPVLAVAVVKGVRWGVAAAIFMGACDLAVRGKVTQTTVTATVIMVLAAMALGYLGNIATRAQEQLRHAAAVDSAHAERERIARDVHDSVLQVLALVQRRGEAIGGEAAELGRLAGAQEAALRALVSRGAAEPEPTGMADLRRTMASLASDRVTVSAPATGVWLAAPVATELLAAVTAATDNIHQHCPAGTRAWILLEDEPDVVTVTVRDDGPGIADGRLAEAAEQGRLGVAQSIRGRIVTLGGEVTVTTAPGQGTEIELRVRRAG